MTRNPVEIGLGRFGVSEHYVEALELVDADPNVDFILTFLDPEQYVEYIKEGWGEGAKKSLIEAAKRLKKPLIVVLKPGSSAKVFEWNGQLELACQLTEGFSHPRGNWERPFWIRSPRISRNRMSISAIWRRLFQTKRILRPEGMQPSDLFPA